MKSNINKEYTIESALAEMQSIKIEVEHTTNKADLKILEAAVNTIDRWYFNTNVVNSQLAKLIRETKKAIKVKLQLS